MSVPNSADISQMGVAAIIDQRYKNVVSDTKRKYSGQFLGQKRDGKGREEDIQKQTIYEGYFRDDKYEGEGILYHQLTKCYFKGIFEDNKKKAGIEIFPNGDIYEGEYKDDKFHGRGYLRNSDLFYYFQDGFPKANMSIHSRLQSTYKYEGEFQNGKRHGVGKETYIKGSVYVGEFRNNMRHGKGRLQFLNSSYYEGDFVNGMPCGFGVHMAYSEEQISQIKPVKEQSITLNQISGQNASQGITQSQMDIIERIAELDLSEGEHSEKDPYENDQRNEQQLNQTSYNRTINNNNMNGEEEEEEDENAHLEEYLYEGEFVDGFKHGIGRLFFPDGSYFYSQWAFNEKISNIIFYDALNHKYIELKYKKNEKINHFSKPPLSPVELQRICIEPTPKFIGGYPPNNIDGFKQLIDDCAVNGDQFEDDGFRTALSSFKTGDNNSSILKKGSDSQIEFNKIKENPNFYFEGKDLFEQQISPNSLIYNELSDYQLIACIEALSFYPQIFFKVFTVRYDIQEVGYINLKLYIKGRWTEFIIDDIMPFYDEGQSCIFSTTISKDIGWLALQKAISKNFGQFLYHKPDSTKPDSDKPNSTKFDPTTNKAEEYFQMLSGLPCKSISWKNADVPIDDDQESSILTLLLDNPISCRIAYLQSRYAREKEIDVPENYGFVIMETIGPQSGGQALTSKENAENTYVILKSVDVNFSRLKRKIPNDSPPLPARVEEAVRRHQHFQYPLNKKFSASSSQNIHIETIKEQQDILYHSVFAMNFQLFCQLFGSVHLLIGVNQNFQSQTEVKEEINTQQIESRFFFSFSLNLPARILLNIEQHTTLVQQDLPIRIVLAQDKSGIGGVKKESDGRGNEHHGVARNKKEFLKRKFLNKVKLKKETDKQIKKDQKKLIQKEKEHGANNENAEEINRKQPEYHNEFEPVQKKKYYNLKYIFGKGQFKKKNIFKQINLQEGTYILMVQIEGPELNRISTQNSGLKSYFLQLVVNIFGDNLLQVQKIAPPDNFVQEIYSACIHQAEKAHTKSLSKPVKDQISDIRFQKSDLGDRENGSDKIIICQYYLHEEGTYLQLLDNRTANKSWRQKLYFITENMKIIDSNDNNKVDAQLGPLSDQLVIIQQIKGLHYHLEGGEGICLIENIQKQQESEGEENEEI